MSLNAGSETISGEKQMASHLGILYRWSNTLHTYFPVLRYWQVTGLAVFSMGVVLARSCQLMVVAEALGFVGKADSVHRRLKRWLANEQIEMAVVIPLWIQWVLSSYAGEELEMLVDETKLGSRIGVLMVSLAYRGRAIPLIWRCYREGDAAAYPAEGQVGMIVAMLATVKPYLPLGCRCRVQADQGIGNSSRLMRALHKAGWHFLFRVKETRMFTTRSGFRFCLRDIAFQGRQGAVIGWLYTRSYRLVLGTLHVIWLEGYDEPWFLFTNDPLAHATAYARRFWQEEGFRDLKSGGWQWQGSFVRDPQHMQRLILVLALAYAWMTTLGTLSFSLPIAVRQQIVAADEQARFSVFRQGLRSFKRLIFFAHRYIHVDLFFLPLPASHPLLC